MPKTLTLEEIASIHHDKLTKMLHELSQKDDTLHNKLTKLLLSQDIKLLEKSIIKDINTIKRGRKFIEYRHSFAFSEKIYAIVEDITTLVDDDKITSKLLQALILTDSKVYLRSDDSAGAIQSAYASAKEAWKKSALSLDNPSLLKALKEMLICDGFGMRDIFSEHFPHDVYTVLYEKVLLLYTIEDEPFEKSSFHHILLAIAHYLKDPKLYIQTKELKDEALVSYDFLDIAGEYQQINDAKSTLFYLEKIEKDYFQKEERFTMKIWAHERLNEPKKITQTYKEWYTQSKSPTIFSKYLERLQGEEKEKALEDVHAEIQELSFHHAIEFYYHLKEKSLCAAYIHLYHDKIETLYIHHKELKLLLSWLAPEYPQAAILLYRDVCEKALQTSQSKYYSGAIWALKEMMQLEHLHPSLDWKIEENSAYMEKLLTKHKQKRKFLELYEKAFTPLS